MNRTLESIRTRAWLLEGCLIREWVSGHKTLDILNAFEHLEYIKEDLRDAGIEVADELGNPWKEYVNERLK
jgi:hypothetical protein